MPSEYFWKHFSFILHDKKRQMTDPAKWLIPPITLLSAPDPKDDDDPSTFDIELCDYFHVEFYFDETITVSFDGTWYLEAEEKHSVQNYGPRTQILAAF